MDIHTLRMMMYLELSRPRGEVDRWPKVYERLMLLNTFASRKPCRPTRTTIPFSTGQGQQSLLPKEHVELVLQWVIQKQRIFAGLDLVHVYQQSLQRRTKRMEWLAHTRKPILFYSPTPKEDMEHVKEEFERLDHTIPHTRHNQHTPPRYHIKIQEKKGGGELLPTLTVLYKGKIPILFAIHQTACHSYFQLPMATTSFTKGRHRPPFHRKSDTMLRIASIDTLVTLYFSLSLLNDKFLTMGSMECLANQLIQLSIQMRTRPERSPFPFISLNCAGHQTSLPSLIRAKVRRMTERKTKLKQVMDPDIPLLLQKKQETPPSSSSRSLRPARSTLRKRRRTPLS
jgi:hypothetical protein